MACEEYGLASRQDLRPAMYDFSFLARFGDHLRRPSRVRYPRKAGSYSWTKYDPALLAPTRATRAPGITKCDRRATLNRDLLHLSIGEEPDPLPVGREERIRGILRPCKQCGLDLIQQPHGKLLFSRRAARHKRQPAAVGRDGRGVTFQLSYNSQIWRQDTGGTWQFGRDTGYGQGWRLQAGSLTPVYSGYFNLDHYIFIDSTGAEYRLDQKNGGVWSSKEAIYVYYDSNTGRLHFTDGSLWTFGCTSGALNRMAARCIQP
jgi:hypothetical protein